MFVFGSANLSATLIKNNLFDEYRLAVVPVILIGRPLFEGGLSRQRLKLLEARPLTSGCVILRYEGYQANEHRSSQDAAPPCGQAGRANSGAPLPSR